MSKFAKVQSTNGTFFYVNLDNVILIEKTESGHTVIRFSETNSVIVNTEPEKIIQ